MKSKKKGKSNEDVMFTHSHGLTLRSVTLIAFNNRKALTG